MLSRDHNNSHLLSARAYGKKKKLKLIVGVLTPNSHLYSSLCHISAFLVLQQGANLHLPVSRASPVAHLENTSFPPRCTPSRLSYFTHQQWRKEQNNYRTFSSGVACLLQSEGQEYRQDSAKQQEERRSRKLGHPSSVCLFLELNQVLVVAPKACLYVCPCLCLRSSLTGAPAAVLLLHGSIRGTSPDCLSASAFISSLSPTLKAALHSKSLDSK